MNQQRSVNLIANDFKKQLWEYINSSPLPACIVSYIVKDISNEVEKTYEKVLLQEELIYNQSKGDEKDVDNLS